MMYKGREQSHVIGWPDLRSYKHVKLKPTDGAPDSSSREIFNFDGRSIMKLRHLCIQLYVAQIAHGALYYLQMTLDNLESGVVRIHKHLFLDVVWVSLIFGSLVFHEYCPSPFITLLE